MTRLAHLWGIRVTKSAALPAGLTSDQLVGPLDARKACPASLPMHDRGSASSWGGPVAARGWSRTRPVPRSEQVRLVPRTVSVAVRAIRRPGASVYGHMADSVGAADVMLWHLRRSEDICDGYGSSGTVKPSAQPTLVRTQHLPPPAKTAPGLRKRGPAGRFLLVASCIRVRHYGSMHGSVHVHMVYSVRAKPAVRITARFRDLLAAGHGDDTDQQVGAGRLRVCGSAADRTRARASGALTRGRTTCLGRRRPTAVIWALAPTASTKPQLPPPLQVPSRHGVIQR